MNNKKAYRALSKVPVALVLLLAFSVIVTTLISAVPSFSKYVLGTVNYTIAVSSIDTFDITGIGSISGTTQVGQTLTAGTLAPSAATASYQWQKCLTAGGTYTDIPGAISDTYILAAGDYNYYIRVMAEGTGNYTGTVISASTGPVSAAPLTPITGIDPIIGTAQVGEMLTAGAVSPSGATVTYQWQKCLTAGGIYTDISGATSSEYTLVSGDATYYIEVKATGTGSYSGTVTSAPTGQVAATSITGIDPIIGTAQVGQTLTAGAVSPSGATVTYQWIRSTTATGTYSNISGATSSTYTLVSGDATYYIKVRVTGTAGYTGTQTSTYVGPVPRPLTAIGAITGTSTVGYTLTAGSVSPSGATVTYQWQECATSNGTYVDISGATSSTYVLNGGDYTYYIRVQVTGTGSYSGTVTSASRGPIAIRALSSIGAITGTTTVQQTLTAGAVAPAGATVTYQWTKCLTTNGTYTDIIGATSNTYTLVGSDYNYYIKVKATGTGGYTGTVTSARTGSKVAACPITGIGTISGTAQVGQMLTAGAVAPSGSTVTYQWQRCSTTNGTYTNITGATSSTYTLTSSDRTYYIRVRVTGTSGYTGTLNSAYIGRVT